MKKQNHTEMNQNACAHRKQTEKQLKLTIFHVESREQRRVLQLVWPK